MSDRGSVAVPKTGFAEIDSQHEVLLERINHLVASVLTDASREDVLAGFDELYEFWENHCRCEEGILESGGSRRLPVMSAEHTRILDRVRNLRQAFADDPEGFRASTDVGEIRRMAIRHSKQYDIVELADIQATKA